MTVFLKQFICFISCSVLSNKTDIDCDKNFFLHYKKESTFICSDFNSFYFILKRIKAEVHKKEKKETTLFELTQSENPFDQKLIAQSPENHNVSDNIIAFEDLSEQKPDCELVEEYREDSFNQEEIAQSGENCTELVQLNTYPQKPSINELQHRNLFYLFGDFLYFKAIEDSLIYAENVPQTATFRPKVKTIKQHFEYEPGYRIGIGYDFDQNRWKLRTSWMYYDIRPPKRHASDVNFSLLATLDIPVWGALGNSLVNSLEGKWGLRMNIADLDVRRHFSFTGFSLAPVGGIKFAYIEQNIHAHYGDFKIDFTDVVTPHDVRGKSGFFGVGPLLGIELNYNLSEQWHFFLNGNFSWLIGNFHTKTTYTNFTPVTPSDPTDSEIKIKNRTSRVSLFEQVQAGINKRWNYKKWAFDFSLGWELQVFQNQMDLNYFSAFVSPPSGSDLSLYGPFIRARLDF